MCLWKSKLKWRVRRSVPAPKMRQRRRMRRVRASPVGAESLDEAIEMVLQLVPPKSGKRWYLEINSLARQSADSFRKKRELE